MPRLISIHVLREEDDLVSFLFSERMWTISIHVLREEDDKDHKVVEVGKRRFLSTSSARRTTRAARRTTKSKIISIHVLREEDDACSQLPVKTPCTFLSTSSARRTTDRVPCVLDIFHISIHVLREEDDLHYSTKSAKSRISIHVLREEDDHRALAVRADLNAFLSTSSARRTTLPASDTSKALSDFYPRPPRGGRLPRADRRGRRRNFYPRPPRGGRLDDTLDGDIRALVFLSTSSARRTTSAPRCRRRSS